MPGFAFKAVVIGGGYATGRELVEFFMPSGPKGGLAGMLLAMCIWSIICALTFLFALQVRARTYHDFFQQLLGRGAIAFELAYFALLLVLLAVFAAAAGAIGAALFGWPELPGTLLFMAGTALIAAFGNEAVERLFKYVTFFLYAVYAVFLAVASTRFAERIAENFAAAALPANWPVGGIEYTGYNIIGAVMILPVLRHMRGSRDAVIAGLLCGPFAMLPAIVFFVCMVAFYPQIASATLPSDLMLSNMNLPVLHFVFQLMIFSALLECGTGSIHAVNERIGKVRAAHGKAFSPAMRFAVTAAVLLASVFLAARFGLVDLIASGYRVLSFVFLAVYVLPLLTLAAWRLKKWKDMGGQSP